MTVGTPAYIAPEQAQGFTAGPQADRYAVGVIAYELLAGRHPFHDTDAPMALVMRHSGEPPRALAHVRPDLPAGVVDWVHAMLARGPAARPPGAAGSWDLMEGVIVDALGPRWRREASLGDPAAPTSDDPPAPPGDATVGDSPAAVLAALIAAAAVSLPGGAEPAAPAAVERTIAPALAADKRLSDALSALEPDRPDAAMKRAGEAAAATGAAPTAVRASRPRGPREGLLQARARRALTAQRAYLDVVRAILRRRAAARSELAALGALSARLAVRLERLEGAIPRASESVGGARRLEHWAIMSG